MKKVVFPKMVFKQHYLFGLLFLISWTIGLQQASAQSIEGKITISGKQAKKAMLKDVVVYYEPVNQVKSEALAEPHEVIMKNKAYHPRVSVVPVGSELKISNRDSILHNAFSPSRSNQFDLGLYGKNKEKIHLLNRSGVVRIFCNVHYHMVAFVLVIETPYYTLTDENGKFNLEGLPPGKGKLFFWHERANRVVKNITVVANGELAANQKIAVDIPITKRRIPVHKTKTGKSYKKKRRRRGY